MAGKGGGAWKVAYADFVTAMMAFFMVMWITGQGKDTKEAIAEYFQDPFDQMHPPGIMGEKAAGPSSKVHGRHLPRGQGQGPNQSGKELAPHVRNGPAPRTTIGEEVIFDEDSAELNAAAKADLDELVPYLAGKPQIIEIRGHASRKPLPPESPYRNAWDLSYQRCLAVRAYLEQLQIEPERIRLCQASPYEPQQPLEKGAEPKTRSRVEVYLLSESVRTATPPPVDPHADDGHGGHDAHGHDSHGHDDPHAKHDAHGHDAHDAHGHDAKDKHDAHRGDAHGKDSHDAAHGPPAKDAHGSDDHGQDKHGKDSHDAAGHDAHADDHAPPPAGKKPPAADEHDKAAEHATPAASDPKHAEPKHDDHGEAKHDEEKSPAPEHGTGELPDAERTSPAPPASKPAAEHKDEHDH